MARRIVLSTMAVLAGIASGASAARAQTAHEIMAGVVMTCSIYGHGCTSAPIRRAESGYEFRMPHGTWVGCRTDCRQALREETVDFWDTKRAAINYP
jgi:hypothetical protein